MSITLIPYRSDTVSLFLQYKMSLKREVGFHQFSSWEALPPSMPRAKFVYPHSGRPSFEVCHFRPAWLEGVGRTALQDSTDRLRAERSPAPVRAPLCVPVASAPIG